MNAGICDRSPGVQSCCNSVRWSAPLTRLYAAEELWYDESFLLTAVEAADG